MFGKTIEALAIAHKLQQKTLVICTNVFLREQWEKEIEKHFGFTPGIIGSGHYNTKPPIVVSNIQTVAKYGLELNSTFGLVIVDEAHHCPASTFSKILDESRARYKIGLTGTLKRKDGLHCTFSGYFSDKVFQPPVNNTINPVVHSYSTDIQIPGNISVPWALRINELYENPAYRTLIVNLIKVYESLGHKILVLVDRVEFANFLHEQITNSYIILGETSGIDRERVLKAVSDSKQSTIIASVSIFKEGISQNDLSCLINATSTNNEALVEQTAGRVMRKADGKLDPVIVDIGLDGITGTRHRSDRFNFYYSLGWEVKPININNIYETLTN
jgi:superfamily II DNA or RNA helicase